MTKTYTPWPFQQRTHNEVVSTVVDRGENLIVSSPTGCHARGTEILMADGTVKAVEGVEVGDVVAGDQLGNPGRLGNTVLRLARGRQQMAQVVPVKGEPFVVNLDHVLTLVWSATDGTRKAGTYVDVTVREWLGWSKTAKHLAKLTRLPVPRFSRDEADLIVPPYLLGVLLGDGSLTQASVSITNPDQEIVAACREEAATLGVDLVEWPAAGCPRYGFSTGKGSQHSPLSAALRELGLAGKKSETKFVPPAYKAGSWETRQEVLAGLLDTDGHLGGGVFDYSSKSETLARDVAFIARSLGLAAYVKPKKASCQTGDCGTHWRVSISGPCEIIPTRVRRKQPAERKQTKSVLRTGFSIELLEEDDYFGFQLDGDQRYLMGDFTITHNSGKSHMQADPMATLQSLGYTVGLMTSRALIVDQMINRVLPMHGIPAGSIPVATAGRFWNLLSRREITMPEVLFIDEAHHGTADTWQRIIDYRLPDGRSTKTVGYTATPMRGVEKEDPAWRGLWDRYYEAINIGQCIRYGYLCPFYLVAEVHGTLGRVDDAKSERRQDLASERLVREKIRYIFETMLRLDPTRPTVYICPTVKAARTLIEYFNLYRRHVNCYIPPVEEMVDETHPEVRKRILTRLARNECSVAAVNILTEGVDVPEISRVVILRESTSAIITVQSYGRGLRPYRDENHNIRWDLKRDCEIVDFTNNVKRFRRKLESLCGIKLVRAAHVLYPDVTFSPGRDEMQVVDEETYVNVDLHPVPPEPVPLPRGSKRPAHVQIGRSLSGGVWIVKLFMDGQSNSYAMSSDKFIRKTQAMTNADYRVRVGGRDDLALNMLARIAGEWRQVAQPEVRLSELLGYALLRQIEHAKDPEKNAATFQSAQRFMRSLPSPAEVDVRVATP